MNYPSVRRWLIEHTSLEPTLLEGAGFGTLVAERLREVGGVTEEEYVSSLGHSPEEVEQLTAGIAVPETWFFRYPHSYGLLVEFLERCLHADRTSLRMASIGCATGEEPYSMAMAAHHAGWHAGAIRIDAFDRNRTALRRAQIGEYGPSSIRTEIPPWAVEFLRRTGAVVVVEPSIREMVTFAHADAIQPNTLAGPPYDLIFCRNLLIYLGESARKQLLDSISESLVSGGLLFVGHAEPLLCGRQALRPVNAAHAFCLERIVEVPAGPVPNVAPTPRSTRPIERASVERRPTNLSVNVPSAPTTVPPAEPAMEDARDLADAGRSAEAEAMVRAILAKGGPSAGALELLGMIRMASNDPAAAKVCFEQALYLEPSRAACILQLAMISESSGDFRRAETLWNRARRASAASEKEPRR